LGVAPNIQPRALSITQGRAVGVAHYLLGGIATTWSFFFGTNCIGWIKFNMF
jgi:photosystem I P700 chlorophyll a apoprotein A1